MHKPKNRVGTKIKTAIGGKSHNRSEDLEKLRAQYDEFRSNLRDFIVSLKHHHSAMDAIARSRLEVAKHVALLTKNSPLYEYSGAMPQAGSPADSVISYYSVHQSLAAKSKMYSSKYGQFVIDYAAEWQRVVVTRCDKTLKEAERLRVEVDHYQSKVESLRQSANGKMAKGKQVDQKAADKLTRNEEKLIKIKEENNKFCANACLLVEELTERSWRDLHPLLIKIFQFDMTLSSDEAKAIENLKTVVHELKRLAASHGIKAEARLKDIESLSASALSTRGESDTLRIEAGVHDLPFGGMSSNSHYPSDPAAPQGSLGYPVPLNSSTDKNGTNHFQPGGSGYSFGGGSAQTGVRSEMSTVDMVAISAAAAPPPSMDQVQAAFESSTSIDSYDSFDSGAHSAPPASAPPPPPEDTNPFGPASTQNTNPFGTSPSSSTSYGVPPTNPFGQPPPSTPPPNPLGNEPSPSSFGSAPMGGSTGLSYGAPMAPAPSPYSQPPPPNAYGGAPLSMYGQSGPASNYSAAPLSYGNNSIGSSTSSGSYSPAPPSYNQAYGQQALPRRTSSNPFE